MVPGALFLGYICLPRSWSKSVRERGRYDGVVECALYGDVMTCALCQE